MYYVVAMRPSLGGSNCSRCGIFTRHPTAYGIYQSLSSPDAKPVHQPSRSIPNDVSLSLWYRSACAGSSHSHDGELRVE